MLPGLLGGHIVIFIDGYYYGFEPEKQQALLIHLFPKAEFNSTVKKEAPEVFLSRWSQSRITRYKFGISEKSHVILLKLLESYCTKAPHDYAVFGKRCFVFMYDLLYKAQVIRRIPKLDTSFLVSIPLFQLWFLRRLLKKQFLVASSLLNKGSEHRIWL